MQKIFLDFRAAKTIGQLHDILASALGFPDYYGKNLDALYDMLTDLGTDTCIDVYGTEQTDIPCTYLHRLVQVLNSAEKDNPCLHVVFRVGSEKTIQKG